MSKKIMPSPMCETGNGDQMQLRELLLSIFNYNTVKQLFQGFLASLLYVWLEKLIEERTLAMLLKRDGRIICSWIRDDNPIRNNPVLYDCHHGCRIAQYMREKLKVQSMYHHAEEISYDVDTLEECEVRGA